MKKSTNNAFTGATNSIKWIGVVPRWATIKDGFLIDGVITANKKGEPVYLPNSRQVRAYSAAGSPK